MSFDGVVIGQIEMVMSHETIRRDLEVASKYLTEEEYNAFVKEWAELMLNTPYSGTMVEVPKKREVIKSSKPIKMRKRKDVTEKKKVLKEGTSKKVKKRKKVLAKK